MEALNSTIVRDLSKKQSPASQRAYIALNEEQREHRKLANKVLGKFNTNGQSKLERLTLRHRLIIAMACEGKTSKDISRAMKCSSATVNRIINDPLGQVEINKYMEGVKGDIKRMLPLAMKVVQENLESGDPDTKMKALDRFIKLNDFVDGKPGQVTNNTTIIDARTMFIQDLKEVAEKAKVIDLTAEVVDG